ncbi:hypothetical protein, partial [uncultured Sulfurimonas sp.]
TLINSGGNIKTKLPILDEVTTMLKSKNITSLKATVELHTTNSDRCRVFDVMSALSSDMDALSVSAFDLLELDGQEYIENDYTKVLVKLDELFDGKIVSQKTLAKQELQEYFDDIVVSKSQEGLVVRSTEFPITYKLKPLHTLDMAVIGYTKEDEKVRELLLSVMDENNNFIQVGIVGNGLDEMLKTSLYEKLSKSHIDSSYLEVDKRKVAFHMVKPEVVMEVSVNELLTENSKGTIKKPFISYDETDGYSLSSIVPSVSLIHPVIKRVRDDKSVNNHDVRLSQITEIVYIDDSETSANDLPKSEVIFREVYTKASKGKTNVKKFMIYKTNKETLDDSFPAYVFYSADFSPTRKDPMKKDIRISNSKEQIELLCKEFMEANVKKGWEQV